MSNKNTLKKEISDLIKILGIIPDMIKDIDFVIEELVSCLKSGKKILICGNGGSAAEAEHLSAEFIVRLKPSKNRKALPIISLS